MKKIISLMLVVVSLFSIMTVSVYAEDANKKTVTVIVNETDFIFDASTSEEFRNKFIAHYFNHDDDGVEAYGLTCTLFGHNLKTSVSTVITHKAKATSPRCLQETYSVETCSRCDYTNSTLLSSAYIVCC